MRMPGTEREVTLRFLAEPTDVNFGGKMHGGMVMRWIDQAGYAAAVGWSGCYCVTVSVGGIEFLQPIIIGDMVSVRALLLRTGTSSMQLGVTVKAKNLQTGAETLTTSCVIIFVALDAAGHPTPVPHFEPQTAADKALAASAQRIVETSKQMESQVAGLANRHPS
jgi:acyl-CoA hydrolase